MTIKYGLFGIAAAIVSGPTMYGMNVGFQDPTCLEDIADGKVTLLDTVPNADDSRASSSFSNRCYSAGEERWYVKFPPEATLQTMRLILGLYRIGPTSVNALREGQVGFAYDTAYLFAEVNAEKCYWLMNEDNSERLIDVRPSE